MGRKIKKKSFVSDWNYATKLPKNTIRLGKGTAVSKPILIMNSVEGEGIKGINTSTSLFQVLIASKLQITLVSRLLVFMWTEFCLETLKILLHLRLINVGQNPVHTNEQMKPGSIWEFICRPFARTRNTPLAMVRVETVLWMPLNSHL